MALERSQHDKKDETPKVEKKTEPIEEKAESKHVLPKMVQLVPITVELIQQMIDNKVADFRTMQNDF